MATIKNINSTQGFDNLLSKVPSSQLLVIDFWATWCGPCKMIAPVFGALVTKYPHVMFLKVDTDRQQELALRFGIRAMPTFVFLRAGVKIDEVQGANPPALTQAVEKHAGPPPKPEVPTDGGWVHLTDQIETSQLTCLNEHPMHGIKTILGSDARNYRRSESWLESDDDSDEQLLIGIPFISAVRIRSVTLFSPVLPALAPKGIKLFINKPNLSFSDIHSESPALEFELKRGESKIELSGPRFQKIKTLHVFIESSQGAENEDDEEEKKTRIDSIEIVGKIEGTTLGSGGEKLENVP